MSPATSENLFRRQAIQALNRQELGRAICLVPPAWSWITALLVLAIVVIVALAPQIEWHRTATVRGWLVPEAGVVRIAIPDAGTVVECNVRIGRQVEKGEVLATIMTGQHDSDGISQQSQNVHLLESALVDSESRERLIKRHAELQLQRAAERTELLKAERHSTEQQIRFEQERHDIERVRTTRLEAAGSAIPMWDLLRQKDALAARLSAIEELRQRLLRIDGELSELQAEERAIPLEAEIATSELSMQRTNIRRELNGAQNEIALIAPVAGYVADLSLAIGDAVRPGAVLVSIIPLGSVLQAELHVPSNSAAQLEGGQTVRLFVDAWPREKYGAINGSVDRVAGFVVEESHGSTGDSYRVLVSIDDTDRPLRPGMSLAAELLLERRDLVDWLIGPIRARFGG